MMLDLAANGCDGVEVVTGSSNADEITLSESVGKRVRLASIEWL